MNRRKFFKLGGGASLAFLINGLPISTFASHPLLEVLAKQAQQNGRVIILIQMNGGNDGLNTVIPLDQYSSLSAARSNILIPQSQVLSLQGTVATGLHPAMTGIRDMFDNGLVNITQGVSYPDPNFSHFRATDIWMTASNSTQVLNSGWLGRYLDEEFPGYPVGYPSSTMPDPLAIQIGTGVSTALQGPNMTMGMAISDINSFYNIVNNTVDPAPATPAGHELTFIRFIAQQTQQYTGVLQAAAANATNLSTQYPAAGNDLADQLKIVARLIVGGLKTPVYVVSTGGYDTHSAQTDATNTATGTHAALLSKLSVAVSAFFDDCAQLGISNRVAAMTMSEFGRRIKSNGSGGTDHGSGAPVMVFGEGVNPGFIGTNPVIPSSVSSSENVAMQNDFRGIYAAVLADWFGLNATAMNDVLLQSFSILPVFKQSAGVHSTATAAGGVNEALGQNFPNPVSRSTSFEFRSEGGQVNIQLFDGQGRLIRVLHHGEAARGTHRVEVDRGGLASGHYFYRLTEGRTVATRKMVME